MTTKPLSRHAARGTMPNYAAVPASNYSYEELAAIYNDTRVDYIVPMPMNARRMEEYILQYDIDLDASVIVLNGNRDVAGLAMLAIRQDRAWITRLGIIPTRRGKGMGRFTLEALLEGAVENGVRRVKLEVIRGNDPAYHLFRKFGFEEIRELMVLRRAPAALTMDAPPGFVCPLSSEEALEYLRERESGSSWIDDTQTLMNATNVEGLTLSVGSERMGWVVYRNTPFQLSHIVLNSYQEKDFDLALALLYHLHTRHPAQDTKLENLPADSPVWPAFQQVGYHESFRRIEMFLDV